VVKTVQELSKRRIGSKVLTGQGAQIDTTTPAGRMIFGIFATLAEFERDLIRERTVAGLAAARARGRKGGRRFALTKVQVRLAQAVMAQRDTSVAALCSEFGIQRVTLYRYVGPDGVLRPYGKRVLGHGKISPNCPSRPMVSPPGSQEHRKHQLFRGFSAA
jgi:DNA invertase Pin-like site-specific DNA recombinase